MPELGHVLAGLARSIAAGDAAGDLNDRLCRAAAELLGCEGGAITLAYTEPDRLTLSATDDTAEEIEARQEVVQEGPGAEAYRSSEYRYTVAEPDTDRGSDWPLLDLSGVDDGHPVVVHAVPMRVGTATVGVLTLWERGRVPTLDPLTAQVVAAVVVAALVHRLHEDDGALVEAWAERSPVQRAVGAVVARRGVDPDEALSMLRAAAYVRGWTMTVTAQELIDGRLSLPSDVDDDPALG